MSKKKKALGATPRRSGEAGSIAAPSAIARHTPGPWKARRGAPEFKCYPFYVANERWVICDVIEHDIAQGNAHLIAAAPDLYEVLKAITVESGFRNLTTENLAKAHAALAKAEGK